MSDRALQFAIATAQAAGGILMQYFGKDLTRSIKTGPNDFATEADTAAEEYILGKIRASFPGDSIITEEAGSFEKKGAEYTWIIDPLDGTSRFASGTLGFGSMISRARGDEIVLATIYDPARELLAACEQGAGVRLNGREVKLESKSNRQQILVSAENKDQPPLQAAGFTVTNAGASANTLAALAGETGGYVSTAGYIWDFAPPVLMLAEAGWKVTDVTGKEFRWDGVQEYGYPGVIAAPVDLHEELLEVITRVENT